MLTIPFEPHASRKIFVFFPAWSVDHICSWLSSGDRIHLKQLKTTLGQLCIVNYNRNHLYIGSCIKTIILIYISLLNEMYFYQITRIISIVFAKRILRSRVWSCKKNGDAIHSRNQKQICATCSRNGSRKTHAWRQNISRRNNESG